MVYYVEALRHAAYSAHCPQCHFGHMQEFVLFVERDFKSVILKAQNVII